MRDIDDPESLIPHITPPLYAELKASGVVNKGMVPKIDNAFAAIEAGVNSVTIKHSDNLTRPTGTTISK